MWRCDEDIEVVGGLVGDVYAPVKFCRQHRWWRITDVLIRWVETSDWWHSDLAASSRGIGGIGGITPDGDLLGEEEIWRVVADPVSGGSDGVYELSHSWGSGRWRLRAVLD
ncbi:MAG: DUF6504 family protein [Propionibacteriaceae bacterium]|jgi:hypothetical protein|nr:DUF6504 family protein [Propionibacteriaceae bacterium]